MELEDHDKESPISAAASSGGERCIYNVKFLKLELRLRRIDDHVLKPSCPSLQRKRGLVANAKKSSISKMLKKFICSTCNSEFLSKNSMEACHPESRPFTCPLCPRAFTIRGQLTRHAQTHTGERPHVCTTCSKAFPTYSNLAGHVELVHTGEDCTKRQYKCTDCDLTFSKKHNLNRHRRLNHFEAKHRCAFCKKSFKTNAERTSHLTTHTYEKPYQCEECGMTFKSKIGCTYHVARIHEKAPKSIFCDVCGKGFHTRVALNEHKSSHMSKDERKKHCCTFCEKEFLTKRGLLLHTKVHTGEERETHQCELCDKSYIEPFRLREHMRQRHTHVGEKPFACKQCPSRFATKSGVIAHEKNRHLPRTPLTCSHCPKTFRYASTLRNHTSQQHSQGRERQDPQYVCTFCSKAFWISNNLERHILTHTKEKPFACEFCQKLFSTAEALKSHSQRSHTESTNRTRYHCEQCSAAYFYPGHLKEHVKQKHDANFKKLPCSYCEKTFGSQSNRLDHERRIHTVGIHRPFSCHFCPKKFKSNSNAQRHLRTHLGEGGRDKPMKVVSRSLNYEYC